ncbi:MAG: FtsK/SpoIIIE domain-containing protein [Ornithinimicrobium sp.]|uniref:FtsK/SpoIIIE domain-containing protein n=1 Tax=Ornithinimicrobium sp. TaxID=1977084 RepID=UPI003D9B1F39
MDDLQDAAEVLAVAMRLRDVTVDRDPDNAARARVALVRRDPLAKRSPSWPHADADAVSLWEPVPVGVDEAGEQVRIPLPEHNVLLGGEPGAGKSAALSLLVATAALDPGVGLHLFDGKLVELATWAGCADHNVGVSIRAANDVLRELQVEMDDRYLALLANRARKVTPDADLPLHVLVVDELAHYLLAPDRKDRTEFTERLRDIVARGRAAGLIVIAATQKPAHDVIPTALRDLIGFRWALRCSTPQASDTVLGAGWASLGFSAADIDAAHRGVGYLLHEGDQDS